MGFGTLADHRHRCGAALRRSCALCLLQSVARAECGLPGTTSTESEGLRSAGGPVNSVWAEAGEFPERGADEQQHSPARRMTGIEFSAGNWVCACSDPRGLHLHRALSPAQSSGLAGCSKCGMPGWGWEPGPSQCLVLLSQCPERKSRPCQGRSPPLCTLPVTAWSHCCGAQRWEMWVLADP